MKGDARNHIVVVEPYTGLLEFQSDEPDENQHAIGLGLPLDELVCALNCRVTILCWDQWFRYETNNLWAQSAETVPISQPSYMDCSETLISSRVKRVPIPARDPEYGRPLAEKGLSPRSHGLINDSGFSFFASYCLSKELKRFFDGDPFQALIMSMWGGLGYVSQMARAAGATNCIDVPVAIVVTDISANRQIANQEGFWTRRAMVKRQMEDVSLALADQVLVFGARGNRIAMDGRLPESVAPVTVPRSVEPALLDKIANASERPVIHSSIGFFMYEPQEAASGVLSALDAVALLTQERWKLPRPVLSAGPSMTFGPMKPRSFEDYWTSRGFVRELVHEHQWEWRRHYPDLGPMFPVRLYPSFFDHLPTVWTELARGSLVILSAAAAEGLAPGKNLPEEVLIEGDPLPPNVAACLKRIAESDVRTLDHIRRALCRLVVEAHRGEGRYRLLEGAVTALERLLHSSPERQDLSRVALMFLDRRLPLRSLAQQDNAPSVVVPRVNGQDQTLSVVVTCYEMGPLIKEAVRSVWASERRPDEVLLVDDGSHTDATLASIQELEQQAMQTGLPLTVIRQRNRGLATARNAGLEAAGGEFISFLDGDDIIDPAFYRLALQLIEKYPRLGGVAAWAHIFGADVPDGFWNAPQAELPFLFTENCLIVPLLTGRNFLLEIGGYDVRHRYNYEDWELGIRILVSGRPIVTIPMHLLRYRVRRDSLYRSMTDVQNQVMRELLFMTHQDTVSKFAMEIAVQLEHRWKRLASVDSRPVVAGPGPEPTNRPRTTTFLSGVGRRLRMCFTRIRRK